MAKNVIAGMECPPEAGEAGDGRCSSFHPFFSISTSSILLLVAMIALFVAILSLLFCLLQKRRQNDLNDVEDGRRGVSRLHRRHSPPLPCQPPPIAIVCQSSYGKGGKQRQEGEEVDIVCIIISE
jgi:hypothetical protein